MDRVLKGEATKPEALRNGTIDLPIGGLTIVLILLAILYGGCMGSFAVVSRWGSAGARGGWLQLAYSAAKVPMLFFLTLLITFPSLYVFNALVGCRLNLGAILRLLIAALAVTLAVLSSFGTIVVFFSLCTTSYPFMVLLNVLMFAIAGVLGMSFLLQTLRRLASVQLAGETTSLPAMPAPLPATSPEAYPPAVVESQVKSGPASMSPPPQAPPMRPSLYKDFSPPGSLSAARSTAPQVRIVFRIWVLLFALIGAQMGWVLRPFIGAPNAPVTFFRTREGNFFQAVADRIADLAGDTLPRNQRNWRSPTTEPEPGGSK
jgi:hypothetical protein